MFRVSGSRVQGCRALVEALTSGLERFAGQAQTFQNPLIKEYTLSFLLDPQYDLGYIP